jgi:hypothetical protein
MLTTSLAAIKSPPPSIPPQATHHVRLCQILNATEPLNGCVLRVTSESTRGVYCAEQVSGKHWQVIAIILADKPRRYHSSLQSSQPEKLVLLECDSDPEARWTIELDRLEAHFNEGRIQEVKS